ncbi:hypothetical protein ABE869_10150 [Enterococcus gilvus]|uniref:hypothetical protein n=1 Tax=Enterococcus gilvus TaxID=160453 RepID=UPI003D6AD5DC
MKFELSLLNKFDGATLNSFLVEMIGDYNQKLLETKQSGKVGKESIQKVLNDFINGLNIVDPEDLRILEKIENTLFLFLFYQDQDTYYHKKIIGENLDVSLIWNLLEQDEEYNPFLDKKLYNSKNEHGIVSIRKDTDNLIILFNYGTYTTSKRREEKQFLVSCRLNFEAKTLSIGIKDSIFSKISEADKESFGKTRYELIQTILKSIYGMKLGLRYEKYGEGLVEEALYELFLDESKRAEELIKQSFESEDEEKRSVDEFKEMAKKFLEENFVLKEPDKFVEKALSMKYQDQATQMPMKSFTNSGGYIFGFSFVEKQITRSDNKSEKKKPIYESKLYWNLKDLIDEYPNLSQLSIYWKFNKYDFDKKTIDSTEDELSFVELDYRSNNNDLVLHYYVKGNQSPILEENSLDRRRREDYALRKINEYLSK